MKLQLKPVFFSSSRFLRNRKLQQKINELGSLTVCFLVTYMRFVSMMKEMYQGPVFICLLCVYVFFVLAVKLLVCNLVLC